MPAFKFPRVARVSILRSDTYSASDRILLLQYEIDGSMRLMSEDEILMGEHRELIELYKHHWTNLFYLGVSYVILNGALASLIGLLLSLKHSIPNLVTPISVAGFVVAITANILFFLFTARIQTHLTSILNKAVAIEKILQRKGLPLDTFERCVVTVKKGKVLGNSKGTYVKLKLWQRVDFFRAIYLFALIVGLSWILMLAGFLVYRVI